MRTNEKNKTKPVEAEQLREVAFTCERKLYKPGHLTCWSRITVAVFLFIHMQVYIAKAKRLQSTGSSSAVGGTSSTHGTRHRILEGDFSFIIIVFLGKFIRQTYGTCYYICSYVHVRNLLVKHCTISTYKVKAIT